MHSPTFPRGGPAATFIATVMQLAGALDIVIDVEHKDREDVCFATLGSFASIQAIGTYSLDLTGIKEEFRFYYDVTASCTQEELLLLMGAPVWRPHA